MSASNYRETHFAFRLRPDLRRAIDDVAAREEEPASIIVRRALKEYIDRRQQRPPERSQAANG